MRRFLAIFCALAIAALPARADFGSWAYNWVSPSAAVVLYTATCATDTGNTDGYTFSTIALTGLSDTASVLVVVGILSEDNASLFGVDGVTIDAAAGTQIVDEDGTGVVNSAIFTSNGLVTGAASVDIVLDHSETITSATVCVWALENLSSTTPTASVVDDDTASGALVLTLDPTTVGGYALGVCANQSVGDTPVWAVLTETQEANNGEHSYSNASAVTTGASMAVTCDYADNTSDATGAAVAFR